MLYGVGNNEQRPNFQLEMSVKIIARQTQSRGQEKGEEGRGIGVREGEREYN